MSVTYRGRTVRYQRYRRYRYRRIRYGGQRLTPAQWAAVITVGLLALGGGGTAVAHHASTSPSPSPVLAVAAPGSICCSRQAWAQAFLRAIPEPDTAANVCAVVVWETREGGGFGNQAAFNPLNVNPGPGTGWPGYNATGAWAFPDAATGLSYSVQTIRNGNYGGVLSALSAGSSPQAVWAAIMASPWAASHYDGTLGGTC